MDRSLFPQYPDQPDRPVRDSCCGALEAPAGIPARVWEYTHGLCHSRTPFTVDAFAAVADCTERQARLAIRAALNHQWLHLVWPEPYMTEPTEQWIGSLARRR